MTYAEAKQKGYTEKRRAYAKGYISRKIDVDQQPVRYSAKGEPYINVPAYNTTRYHVRVYLEEPAQ